mgnify:CR=1 FL=1
MYMVTINAQIVRLTSIHAALANIMMIMIQLCSLVTPNAMTNNQFKIDIEITSKSKTQPMPLMER